MEVIGNKPQKVSFKKLERIVGVLFLIALIPTLRNITEENDINIFFLAAKSLREGRSMYLGPQMYGMWYYYSPLFAACLVPFTYLPLQVIKLVWLALGLFLVSRIYNLLKYHLSIPENQNGKWFLIVLSAASVYPVYMNLLYGQMTILMVWCCLEAAKLLSENKPIKSAFSYAIGINIKILPIFFFYYYFLKSNYKFIIYLFLAVAALVLIPYLFIHPSFHTDLLVQWKNLINPFNREHVTTVGEGGFMDFASIVTKYCTDLSIKTEAQLNFTNLSHSQVLYIQMAYRVLILALVALATTKIHKRIADPKMRQWCDTGFVLLCTISAFPHQRDYSVFMALPCFAFLAHSYFIQGFRPHKLVLLITALVLILMGFLLFPQFLGTKGSFYLHEKRIPGMASIILIPIYLYWIKRYTAFMSLKP